MGASTMRSQVRWRQFERIPTVHIIGEAMPQAGDALRSVGLSHSSVDSLRK
jgi:hypothetical protein